MPIHFVMDHIRNAARVLYTHTRPRDAVIDQPLAAVTVYYYTGVPACVAVCNSFCDDVGDRKPSSAGGHGCSGRTPAVYIAAATTDHAPSTSMCVCVCSAQNAFFCSFILFSVVTNIRGTSKCLQRLRVFLINGQHNARADKFLNTSPPPTQKHCP